MHSHLLEGAESKGGQMLNCSATQLGSCHSGRKQHAVSKHFSGSKYYRAFPKPQEDQRQCCSPQWHQAPTIWLDQFPRPCSLGVYITLSPPRPGRLPVLGRYWLLSLAQLQKPSGEASAAGVKGERSTSSLPGISYYFCAFEITCFWC